MGPQKISLLLGRKLWIGKVSGLGLLPYSPQSLSLTLAPFSIFMFPISRFFYNQLAVPIKLSSPPFRIASSMESVVTEYAKSNRSSCKSCSKPIESKTLRLGLLSKDKRGYVVTKWHHLHCFPILSHSPPPDTIAGFSSLNNTDQETLKKLFAEQQPQTEEEENRDSKKRKFTTMMNNNNNNNNDNNNLISFSVSDVKNTYKDATLLPKWKAFETVIFLEQDVNDLHDSSKIAAFDFDGCLAKTAVNRIGANFWSLMYPSIPDKLRSLYNDGYKLVIFTNESNIERWTKKRQVAVDSKIGRLNSFIEKVNVPIQVFIACGKGDDRFRKPNPGMWRLMEQELNSGIGIDMDQSFYVGDAAGRESDHSDADIKFAEAVGLKFHVPEDYFHA